MFNFDSQLVGGGAAVGMAWVIREVISYLKTKDSSECTDHCKNYRPDAEWKTYCTQRFDGLLERLGKVDSTQELMKLQITRLEIISIANKREN